MLAQDNRIKLSDIINQKKRDIAKLTELKPLKTLKEEIETFNIHHNKQTNFRTALDNNNDVGIIYEYKPASPSKGDISNITLSDALDVYVKSGAAAVSVLTEEKFFKGKLQNIVSASKLTRLPILMKDFVLDEYQIYQAKNVGASAVLLMSGIYPDIAKGISLCRDLELDVLVECKNRNDIKSALESGADIVGINNRNFQDFTVDLKTTENLAKYVPPEVILVSESGIQGPEDVEYLSKYGVDAFLIGSAVMGSSNKISMLNAAKNIVETAKGARVVRK